MRWTPSGRSRNLEDRRGGGGFGGLPIGRGGLGIGGVLVLLLLSMFFGRDFLGVMGGGGVGPSPAGQAVNDPAEERSVEFVSFVLDDAQRTWAQKFAESGAQYREAKLVLFRDATTSACGHAQSATGPFYCPADEKIYVDLSFFDELHQRFGAPGDFAQAYVLAHEIGHHVQNVLGVEQQVRRAQGRNPGARNELSVRMELQADCFAGVWGNATSRKGVLETGDIEEGLRAAAAIGDDRLQRMSGQAVSPDSFTHGTSEQRAQWLRRGLESGSVQACNTFK